MQWNRFLILEAELSHGVAWLALVIWKCLENVSRESYMESLVASVALAPLAGVAQWDPAGLAPLAADAKKVAHFWDVEVAWSLAAGVLWVGFHCLRGLVVLGGHVLLGWLHGSHGLLHGALSRVVCHGLQCGGWQSAWQCLGSWNGCISKIILLQTTNFSKVKAIANKIGQAQHGTQKSARCLDMQDCS